jgi:hypothetical protein
MTEAIPAASGSSKFGAAWEVGLTYAAIDGLDWDSAEAHQRGKFPQHLRGCPRSPTDRLARGFDERLAEAAVHS